MGFMRHPDVVFHSGTFLHFVFRFSLVERKTKYRLGLTQVAHWAFGSPSTGSGTAVRYVSTVCDFPRVARKIAYKKIGSTLLPQAKCGVVPQNNATA
jgi:hypothetical protein